MKINPNHPWAKYPRWKKRIMGFFCYLLNAFVALIWPETADMVMYGMLKEQFIDDEPKKEK